MHTHTHTHILSRQSIILLLIGTIERVPNIKKQEMRYSILGIIDNAIDKNCMLTRIFPKSWSIRPYCRPYCGLRCSQRPKMEVRIFLK